MNLTDFTIPCPIGLSSMTIYDRRGGDMRSLDNLLMILFLSAILVCTPAAATEMVGADQYNLGEGEVLEDDLIVAGGTIMIDGDVSGDLIAAGGNIEVAGRVDDDAWIAGGSLIIDGEIGDDLRAAGGDIRLRGSVADNAMIAGGTITTSSNSDVGGDLDVAGGSIEIAGHVGADLSCNGGSVVIGGTVDGNATICADDIRILQSARIQGDLEYTSDKEIEIPAGTVMGDVVYKRSEKKVEDIYSKTTASIISFLSILLIGLLMVRFKRNTTIKVSDTITTQILKSLGSGVLLLIIIPLVALVLMVTVIGIPLGLIVLFAYIVILYISEIFVGLAIGRRIVTYAKKEISSPYWHLVVGLIVIAFATRLPLIGFLISLIVILAGLGALVMTWKSMSDESKSM
jgi:cytoskeletal protein CcmA (bactofilin family)